MVGHDIEVTYIELPSNLMHCLVLASLPFAVY